MPTARIPRTDQERAVLAYLPYEESLKRVMLRLQVAYARGAFATIRGILERAGYDGTNRLQVMLRQADAGTLHAIEEIAGRCSDIDRARIMRRMYGQIASGTLTVRKAIRDVLGFSVYAESKKAHDDGLRVMESLAEESYARGSFEIMKDVGISWEMGRMGTRKADVLAERRWSKSKIEEWLGPIGDRVMKEVEEGMLLGESNAKIAKRITDVEQVSRARAERDARTITSYISNEAKARSYDDHGVKRYEWTCTFDERTCPACGHLDKRAFPVSERDVGINYPPLHPKCRCSTRVAMSKELRERLYANKRKERKDGTVEYIDATMTFDEWVANGRRWKPGR